MLSGKSGEVSIKASVLAGALIKEWLAPQIKTYASVYHNDPATYKALTREARIASELLVENTENMDNLAKHFQAMTKGRTSNPQQRISLLNQMSIIDGKVRESMAQFKGIHDRYTPAKIPDNIGGLSKNIATYDYEPPTVLLKVNDKLKALEGRMRTISKTLEQGKGEISKETDTTVSQGLVNIKKAIQDMYNQTKYIDMLYTHNVSFSTAYLDYLSVMGSVDWN